MKPIEPRRFAAGRAAPLRAAVAVALVCVVAAACSGSSRRASPSGPSPSAGPSTAGGTASTGHQGGSSLHWHSCKGDLQCANLKVPLDWSKPRGEEISLYVVRKPATGDARRLGSVFFNFGGPGEAGGSSFSDYLDSFDSAAKRLNQRFDLVSWDPRGTGKSAGVACTTRAEALQPDPDPSPDTPQETTALRNHLVDQTNRCLKADGSELPYIDTWSSAQDLDALRSAVGDKKLSYVGFSYGSLLGADYLARFPGRTRAMVLDGIDQPQPPIRASFDQAKGFESALNDLLTSCKQQGTRCPFGDGNPQAAFQTLRLKLENGARLPARGQCAAAPGLPARERHATVGIGELLTAAAQTLYDTQIWPIFEAGLAQLANPAHPNGACVLGLRDYYEGFQPGTGEFDHILDAFTAISCADQRERATNPLGDDPALGAQWAKTLPVFGASFASGLPGCWHFPPARHPLAPFNRSDFSGSPPVVLVGNTGDPATPYSHAQAVHGIIPNSVLVTFVSTEHTAYLSHHSACLDDPLTSYLITTDTPREGLRCRP